MRQVSETGEVMACCVGCLNGAGCHSTLGQYPAISEGHAIPYNLTQSELTQFLSRHAGDSALSSYLWSKNPPYGIIINEDYGQYLVWFDQSGVLHVIDVTNLSIASQVQKAPFESPDASIIQNMIDQISALTHAAAGIGVLAGLIVVAFLVWRTAR